MLREKGGEGGLLSKKIGVANMSLFGKNIFFTRQNPLWEKEQKPTILLRSLGGRPEKPNPARTIDTLADGS